MAVLTLVCAHTGLRGSLFLNGHQCHFEEQKEPLVQKTCQSPHSGERECELPYPLCSLEHLSRDGVIFSTVLDLRVI